MTIRAVTQAGVPARLRRRSGYRTVSERSSGLELVVRHEAPRWLGRRRRRRRACASSPYRRCTSARNAYVALTLHDGTTNGGIPGTCDHAAGRSARASTRARPLSGPGTPQFPLADRHSRAGLRGGPRPLAPGEGRAARARLVAAAEARPAGAARAAPARAQTRRAARSIRVLGLRRRRRRRRPALQHVGGPPRAGLARGERRLRETSDPVRDLRFHACEGSTQRRPPPAPALLHHPVRPQARDRPGLRAVVHWADVMVIATPIRWGAASSLTPMIDA